MFGRARLLALMVLAVVACDFDWDAFDPRLGGGNGGDTSAGGASGGHGGMPGAGAMSANGGSGAVISAGGMGGSGAKLVDRGLLTRYFVNEAASGTGESQLIDAAPNPLALSLDYGDVNTGLTTGAGGGGGAGGAGGTTGVGAGGPNMMFTEIDGHRGLRWIRRNS